jgi:hypothetical protein
MHCVGCVEGRSEGRLEAIGARLLVGIDDKEVGTEVGNSEFENVVGGSILDALGEVDGAKEGFIEGSLIGIFDGLSDL